MMEYLSKKSCSRDEFLQRAGESYDSFLLDRPPIYKGAAKKLRKEFLQMMGIAYDKDPHNEVLAAEDWYCFEYENGIKLQGYIDRVEKSADGENIVVDFKTGHKVQHIEDDFNTCMQVIIYAWLCEQHGIDISGCEYRYLRKGRTVKCKYNESMKEQLAELLGYFKHCIETNDFPRNETDVSCKYCRMKDICEWPDEAAGEEDDDHE